MFWAWMARRRFCRRLQRIRRLPRLRAVPFDRGKRVTSELRLREDLSEVILAEPQKKSAARLNSISPQFAMPDVVVAAEYYRDVLGFEILGYFLEPPIYAIVRRDSVEIHFSKIDPKIEAAPNIRRRDQSIDAYIWVNDLDPLYEELQERGANVVEAPALRIYKCYEMVVQDHAGFRLAFGMDVSRPRNSAAR